MKPEWAACSCECRKCWRSRPPEGLRAPSERRLLLQQPLRTCLTAVLPYRTSCLAQLVSAPRARSLTRAHDYRTSCLAQLRSAGTGSTTTKCLFTHHRTKSLAQSPTAKVGRSRTAVRILPTFPPGQENATAPQNCHVKSSDQTSGLESYFAATGLRFGFWRRARPFFGS